MIHIIDNVSYPSLLSAPTEFGIGSKDSLLILGYLKIIRLTKILIFCLSHYHTILTFNDPKNEVYRVENIVGKRENADNQHFLLFPQCFLPYQTQKPSFELHLFCRLQMLSIWSCPQFCCLVKGNKRAMMALYHSTG